MANPNPTGNRYTSENQPKKRGRLKSIFGPLAKENNLSLDDVRKVYKNILTAKSFVELDGIKKKYPSTLTDMTVDMLKQDKLGRVNGKMTIVQSENGETIRVIGERIKSYETIQYMLDRIYGTPTKVDLNVTGNLGMDVNDLSHEENDARILELMKELGYDQGKAEGIS